MVHALKDYNGIKIVTPEADLSADRQALNENFKTLADIGVRNPMTSNLNAGGNDIFNLGAGTGDAALAVNGGSVTSLDGGQITTDGSGNVTACKGLTLTRIPPYQLTNIGTDITVAAGIGSNSYHAIQFPGGTNTSYLIGPAILPAGASPKVLAVVGKLAVVNTRFPAFAQQGPDTAGQLYGINFNGGVSGDFQFQTYTTEIQGLAGDTDLHVFAAVYDGSNKMFYIDGTAYGPETVALDTQPGGGFVVGSDSLGYWGLAGLVGDVIVLDAVPADLTTPTTGFLAQLQSRWFGTDTLASYLAGLGASVLLWLDPNEGVTSSGGNVTAWQARPMVSGAGAQISSDINGSFIVTNPGSGGTSLDSGQITTDGLGTLCLHAQGTPPAAVAGGIYFDGTNFNFCADGTHWVALTLP